MRWTSTAEQVNRPTAAAIDATHAYAAELDSQLSEPWDMIVFDGYGSGWALDRWLGTRPWGTIVLFFLGVAAGMLSVYRAITGIKMAVGYRRLDGPAGRKRAKGAWDEDEE